MLKFVASFFSKNENSLIRSFTTAIYTIGFPALGLSAGTPFALSALHLAFLLTIWKSALPPLQTSESVAVAVEHSYFLDYERHDAFGWCFNSDLYELASLTDYQRLVIFNDVSTLYFQLSYAPRFNMCSLMS